MGLVGEADTDVLGDNYLAEESSVSLQGLVSDVLAGVGAVGIDTKDVVALW